MISPPSSTGPAAFYFKASRQPMLWAACVYGLGIIFGKYEWRPTSWWFLSLGTFVVAAAYFSVRRARSAWLLALGSFFLAGALHIQLRASKERLDITILPYADRRTISHRPRDQRWTRASKRLRRDSAIHRRRSRADSNRKRRNRSGAFW